jgi:hypothetical protein
MWLVKVFALFVVAPGMLGYLHKLKIWTFEYVRWRHSHGKMPPIKPMWLFMYPCLVCDEVECDMFVSDTLRRNGDYSFGFFIDLCHWLLGWQYLMLVITIVLVVWAIGLACSCCRAPRRRALYTIVTETSS